MPELPEVESLARFLAEQAAGRTVERAEVAAFAALKTFDPPLDALRRPHRHRGRRGGASSCCCDRRTRSGW